ncbi:MAG: hypothetical protein CMO63_00265 [Verrucomicrobiales bacterium]|nr:hypothetical protein [Verrucomicrobiales bacterium]
MRKAPLIILICGLGIVGALVWASFTAETTAGLAKPHAEHLKMWTSGGMQRDLGVWTPGMVVGYLTIIAAGAGFTLGVKRIALRDITIATVLSLVAFTGMMIAYRSYAIADEHVVSGWFSSPVNWQLFGLVIFPSAFVVVWVLGFQRWVYSPEDQAKFDSLLKRSRSAKKREGGE